MQTFSHYIYTVYDLFSPHAFLNVAMFQVVQTIKQESGDVPTETRELQVANFVGPTLVDLGLYSWMEKHGGIVSYMTIKSLTQCVDAGLELLTVS